MTSHEEIHERLDRLETLMTEVKTALLGTLENPCGIVSRLVTVEKRQKTLLNFGQWTIGVIGSVLSVILTKLFI